MSQPQDQQFTSVLDHPALSVLDVLPSHGDDGGPLFPMSFRGYDRVEVEAHLADLTEQLDAAGDARAILERQLAEARHELAVATAADREAGHPAYAQMGERVAQIFALAEQEAADLNERAAMALSAAQAEAVRVVTAAREAGDEIIETSRVAAAGVDAERARRLAEVDAEIAAMLQVADADIAAKQGAAATELAATEQRRAEVADEVQSLISRITTAASS